MGVLPKGVDVIFVGDVEHRIGSVPMCDMLDIANEVRIKKIIRARRIAAGEGLSGADLDAFVAAERKEIGSADDFAAQLQKIEMMFPIVERGLANAGVSNPGEVLKEMTDTETASAFEAVLKLSGLISDKPEDKPSAPSKRRSKASKP